MSHLSELSARISSFTRVSPFYRGFHFSSFLSSLRKIESANNYDHAYVKFVNQEGKLEGIISVKKLLATIDREKYWLVEIESNENPPICKLIEKKLAYEKSKKQIQNTPIVTKELQMTWKVDDHDLMHKISRAKSWLVKGYQVEIVISNRGVQKKKRALDRTIMDKILNELKEYSKEIREPKWTGGSVILQMTGKGVDNEKTE
ncbi:22348_t:CDS:2 [Dentiscutata erythropus]|uniref:22348_t:CDS:1 n=1 Tax=Dentiscutata erythropus TaxID=1348616 RepID=A0A9N9P072_9GLOM|nr:22348_t:CDS:2 [Dentiscutata erythropus]